jgi:hypothetical protein
LPDHTQAALGLPGLIRVQQGIVDALLADDIRL